MQIDNKNHFDSSPEQHKKMLQMIGLCIRELRLAYGMTQKEFATQQGIGKNSLQNAEYGKNVTLLSFFKIVDGLISTNDFFELME